MEKEKITSDIIKTALLHKLCLKHGMIAATEISYMMYQADILAYPKKDKNKLIEYEIKINVNDLKSDFIHKEIKHNVLLNPKSDTIKTLDVPNYFYFAIPFELIKPCQELLVQYNKSKYGIAVYSEYRIVKEKDEWILTEHKINAIDDRVFIIKPARKLFEPISYKKEIESLQYKILLRLMYQNINFMKQKYFHMGGYDSPDTISKLKKEIKYLRENKDEQIEKLSTKFWNELDTDIEIELNKVMETKWSGYCKFNKIMTLIKRQEDRNKERKSNGN
jgi:hypothetical protein